jgi:polyphosphate kinase
MADQLPDVDAVRAQLDMLAAELDLRIRQRKNGRVALLRADGTAIAPWREDYPYPTRLTRKPYEHDKRLLQIELLKLQRSVKESGDRILVIFEGRDAAGKGGAIRRVAEHLNPRGVRVVALEKPAAHEQGDNYLRRYSQHLPVPGEIVMFDRSWYNRAGVEHVMGFCQPDEYARFLADVPDFENGLVAGGVKVIKLWFSITRAEQLRRFIDRHADPVKSWKLSAIDLASLDKWDEYTRAREAMFQHTDLPAAPWIVVKGNDKKRARLEVMRHVLSLFDYDDKQPAIACDPDPLIIWPAGRGRLADGLPPEHGDLIERDPRGDAGVQRLGAADRDLHDHVAALRYQPGQALAFRADDQNKRAGGQRQRADLLIGVRVETDEEQSGARVAG